MDAARLEVVERARRELAGGGARRDLLGVDGAVGGCCVRTAPGASFAPCTAQSPSSAVPTAPSASALDAASRLARRPQAPAAAGRRRRCARRARRDRPRRTRACRASPRAAAARRRTPPRARCCGGTASGAILDDVTASSASSVDVMPPADQLLPQLRSVGSDRAREDQGGRAPHRASAVAQKFADRAMPISPEILTKK